MTRIEEIVMILERLQAWGVNLRLEGAASLIWCAHEAVDLRAAGRPWGIMELAARRAERLDDTQWNVWIRMQYALRRSRGPKGPGEAVAALIEVPDES